MRLGLASLLLLLLTGCSSSSPSSPAKAPAPSWVDPPSSVDLYEGRTQTVPITLQGSPNVRLEPAQAIEGVTIEVSADGKQLLFRVPYRAAAKPPPTIAIDVVDGDVRSTVNIAVRAHSLSWKPRTTWPKESGPQTREHGVFMLDGAANTAFLFQGSGYSPQWVPIEDSWRLDLASGAWSAWTPTGDVPPAGAARRIANVPGSTIAYVHGGYTGWETTEKTEADLYRLDVGQPDRHFTKLNGTPPESPRQLHAMGYDTTSSQLIVFGGYTSTPSQAFLNDTWLVKVSKDSPDATWTKVKAKGPSARYGAFYGFDEPSRRFIVWSGAQRPTSNDDPVNPADDAWALDLTYDPPAWFKIETKGEAPPGRRNGCVMHDPIGRRLFVFGGTGDGKTTRPGLWVLDLEPEHEAWTKLDSIANAPPARSSGFGFATPDGSVACAFGNDDNTYADVNVLGYFD